MPAPFPPLLALTLTVIGATIIVRHVTREWNRAKDLEREQANAAMARAQQPIRKLRRDPQTGIYRP